MMKKWIAWSLLTGLMVAPLSSAVQAQPRGGMMGMRNSPKMRLSGLWRGVGRLETSSAPLTKEQARKILAVVRPWNTRPTMSDAEAVTLSTRINALLTTSQKSELAKAPAGEGRGAGGRGQWGRGGAGGGGGQWERGGGASGGFDPQKMRAQMQKMQGFMKTMNPFYPPRKYKEVQDLPERMREGMTRRYRAVRATMMNLARKAA